VISWGTILYGAGLSVAVAVVAIVIVARDRSALVLGPAAAATFAGPVSWNATLHTTHASGFFTDAPIAVFPVSWQDTGSGVFAFALAVAALSALRPHVRSSRTVMLATICGAGALLVDIYLY